MARILVGTVPIGGHVAPMAMLVRGLVDAGHEVVWYSGSKYRLAIEASGAKFVGRTAAVDYDDARFEHVPERANHTGIGQLEFDLKHIFIDDVPGQLEDLRAIHRDFAAVLLLADPAFIGGLAFSELEGVPFAVLGVLPMSMGSIDTAPYGLGLPPSASTLGRLRNRALRWSVEKVVFAGVQKHWNATRESLGLPPAGFLMDAARAAALFLQPTVPSFEYPRSDLPANVRFIGRMPVAAPADWEPPSWWHELDGDRPVVHVTQGTLANVAPELIAPAIEGLAREDVLVVVSTGGRDPESLGLTKVPSNVRVHRFLSYPELLPRTNVMVTNGGYGGVQMALAHGVPVIVAGTTEDKPEVAARVAWSGTGLDLKTATPTPAAVRTAVRRVIDEPSFRTRARELAAEHATFDAVALGVALVSEVCRSERWSDAAESALAAPSTTAHGIRTDRPRHRAAPLP